MSLSGAGVACREEPFSAAGGRERVDVPGLVWRKGERGRERGRERETERENKRRSGPRLRPLGLLTCRLHTGVEGRGAPRLRTCGPPRGPPRSPNQGQRIRLGGWIAGRTERTNREGKGGRRDRTGPRGGLASSPGGASIRGHGHRPSPKRAHRSVTGHASEALERGLGGGWRRGRHVGALRIAGASLSGSF